MKGPAGFRWLHGGKPHPRVLALFAKLLPWCGLVLLAAALWLLFAPSPPSGVHEGAGPAAPPSTFENVVLDPGHGGVDDGAAANGLQEKTITLDLAQRIARELTDAGLTAVLTRQSDTYVSLSQRVEIADQVPRAIFVSIHCNLSRDPSVHGFEIYRSNTKSTPLQVAASPANLDAVEDRLSQCLTGAIAALTHQADHGQRTAGFYVVRNVPYPAVLVECGFLSNVQEARHLADPIFRQTVAHAIALGILDYRAVAAANALKSAWQNRAGQMMVAR